jgi:predicted alpha/beta superfamily hydrolase
MSRSAPTHNATTAPHVHVFVRSRFGVAGRRVRVWLPPNYATAPTQRFPVLYLQDGQNVFDDATAFAGIGWRAHEAAARLIARSKVPPLLLVGIDHAGEHRIDDYAPQRWQGRGGHADDYGRMLTEEIKPFVDAHYRTLPGREDTGIAGASLGGLVALHMGLTRPDVFSRVGALSPSCWWAEGAILRHLTALPGRLPLRIWLDAGTRETPHLRDGVRSTAELLAAKGWVEHRVARSADLRCAEIAGAKHDEKAWRKRFGRVLQFLWPTPRQRRSDIQKRKPRS